MKKFSNSPHVWNPSEALQEFHDGEAPKAARSSKAETKRANIEIAIVADDHGYARLPPVACDIDRC
jgi:hypothetical protein